MSITKKILLLLAFIYFSSVGLWLSAQTDARSKQARKADSFFKKCIEKQDNTNLEVDFSIYDWAKNLQNLVGQVLYQENTEVLIEIADEEETVRSLLQLTKKCDVAANLEKEIQKLIEIYDESMKDKSNTQMDPNQGFYESRKVTFSVSDARRMKVQINSIVNRLEGDDSIFRKLR